MAGRVNQHYVEIIVDLGSIYVVGHELGLVQTVDANIQNEDTNSTIYLSHSFTVELDIALSNDLGLTSILRRSLPQNVISNIGLAHLWQHTQLYGLEPNFIDELALTGVAEFWSPTQIYLTDNLTLSNPLTAQAPYRLAVDDRFTFVQTLYAARSYSVSIYSFLAMLESGIRDVYNESIVDELSITHYLPDTASNTLSLTQVVVASRGYSIFNSLHPYHLSIASSAYTRGGSHNLSMGQYFTYSIEDNPCFKKQYTPFTGNSTFPEIRQSRYSANEGSVILSYPVGEPVSTVVLRAPIFDNIERLHQIRAVHETRGGCVSISGNSDPTYKTLLFTIVGLKASEADEFETFLNSTLGKQMQVQDWTGVVWRGIITTPNDAIIENTKNRFDISFEFEGTIYDDDKAPSELSLGDLVGVYKEIPRACKDEVSLVDSVGWSRQLLLTDTLEISETYTAYPYMLDVDDLVLTGTVEYILDP